MTDTAKKEPNQIAAIVLHVETSPGVFEHFTLAGTKQGGMFVDASPPVISVTPSAVTEYDPPLTAIRIGTTAGDVEVVSGGATVVIPNVQVGEVIPGEFTQVLEGNTTATGINGWQR